MLLLLSPSAALRELADLAAVEEVPVVRVVRGDSLFLGRDCLLLGLYHSRLSAKVRMQEPLEMAEGGLCDH